MSELADRLGRRTLELVDIESQSLHEAEIRERLRSLVPSSYAPVFEGDEAFLWARKLWWMVPIVASLVLVGILVVLASSSPVSPFIYTLF